MDICELQYLAALSEASKVTGTTKWLQLIIKYGTHRQATLVESS